MWPRRTSRTARPRSPSTARKDSPALDRRLPKTRRKVACRPASPIEQWPITGRPRQVMGGRGSRAGPGHLLWPGSAATAAGVGSFRRRAAAKARTRSNRGGARPRRPGAAVKSRFSSLDGLRGIAALVVVLHHGAISHDYALYSGLPADSRFDGDLALSGMPFLLVAAGDFAVSLFLVLSGFVLAHSYLHSTLGTVGAAVKRYARLTIPIAATSLVSLATAVATPGFALPGAEGAGRGGADLLAALRTCLVEAFYGSTIGGIHEPSYNGVLWTIPIEFQGSLLLIALFAVARFAAANAAAKPERVVDFAGAGALLLLLATWHSRLGLFGAGATLYRLFGPPRPQRRDLATWAGKAIVVLALFLGTMPRS